MARVLKGHYFKHRDIMDAEIGCNPSYIWWSLMWGRDLLRKWLCWKVGNGQQIVASRDPWIPSVPNFTSKYGRSSTNNTNVAKYILESGDWDEQAVRQDFCPWEAEAILDIPLLRQGREDSRFWKGSREGKYTVKAGYNLEMNNTSPPSFQSTQPAQFWWKYIWKLRIPPKICIFMWRASRDFIPAPLNLLHHHVPTNGICVLCKSHFASTKHTILFCPAIRNIWHKSLFWSHLKEFCAGTFIDIAIAFSKNFKIEEMEMFSILCWAIWTESCKITLANLEHVREINMDWAASLLDSFRLSIEACYVKRDAQTRVERGWLPPLSNHFRMDVDAGFDLERNKYSVGVVIRDSHGRVRGASACSIRNPGSVKGAELHAIRFGMEFCLRLGIKGVCIFSDSSQAINSILVPDDDFGPTGLLALEIQAIMDPTIILSLQHM